MVALTEVIWMTVCLYRPGNIGHHSVTCASNPNDFQSMIIDACMKVECAPDKDKWAFEITPVDFLVKSIVLFASKPSHFGQVFNVVQNDTVPARTVFDLLLEMNSYLIMYPLMSGNRGYIQRQKKKVIIF